jgi:hypothetical protein
VLDVHVAYMAAINDADRVIRNEHARLARDLALVPPKPAFVA